MILTDWKSPLHSIELPFSGLRISEIKNKLCQILYDCEYCTSQGTKTTFNTKANHIITDLKQNPSINSTWAGLYGRNVKCISHDDVIKWKHFPRCWPLVRGIQRSPVNSPHKGQWRGALMFSLICVWINGWVNNREAGDLRCYCTHCDVIVMIS